MKQRLLVMNGQKLVQTEHDGQWAITKVEKAGPIKPGLYNLYQAASADKTCSHDGMIVHVGQERVYQQVGKAMVCHALASFGKVPDLGSNVRVQYKENQAQVTAPAIRRGRGVSR